MTRELAAALVAVAVSAAGCAGHGAQAPSSRAADASQAAPGATRPGTMAACPMAVSGAQVAAAEAPGGESITFTTSPDHVADLRARVRAMADMHNHHHADMASEGMHGGHGGMIGGGTGSSDAGVGAMGTTMMPPPSQATVDDVDGGARIVVTPKDPADLERLRSTVRMHVEHMRESGTCEMHEPH